MAASFTKRLLSGSTNGRGILVTGVTTGASVTIHTATSGAGAADDMDEVYLWAVNHDAAAVTLSLEWGGTTDPDDVIPITLPPEGEGAVLVVAGALLQNSLVIKAFASKASKVTIHGFVNRIADA